jgi:hypothetical protein
MEFFLMQPRPVPEVDGIASGRYGDINVETLDNSTSDRLGVGQILIEPSRALLGLFAFRRLMREAGMNRHSSKSGVEAWGSSRPCNSQASGRQVRTPEQVAAIREVLLVLRDPTKLPADLDILPVTPGAYGVYDVRLQDGCYMVTCPKGPAGAKLKRTGANFDYGRTAWTVPDTTVDAFVEFIAKSSAREATMKRDEVTLASSRHVSVEVLGETIVLRSEYDEARVARMRGLKGATWDGGLKVWMVKWRWRARVAAFLGDERRRDRADSSAAAQARKDGEAALAAIVSRRHEFPHVKIAPAHGSGIEIAFQYDEAANALVRALPSTRWRRPTWIVPASGVVMLLASLPRIEGLAAAAVVRHTAEKRGLAHSRQAAFEERQMAERAEQEARQTAEDAAMSARGETFDFLWGTKRGCGVALGSVYQRKDGFWRVVEISKREFVGDDAMSVGGMDTDREWQYQVRIRPATRKERAPLHKAALIDRRRRAALRRVEDFSAMAYRVGVCPAADAVVVGEVVYDSGNIVGGGHKIVVADDALWHIERNSMDGDDWSRNTVHVNGGGSGYGHRLPRDARLERRLRQAWVILGGGKADVID